jgi:PAS domain S-box-containing protein
MPKLKSLANPRSFARSKPSLPLRGLWEFLPSGESLPAAVWQTRHRFLLRLTWLHALLIALIAVVFGDSWEFSLAALLRDGTVLRTTAEAIIVGLFASVAALTTGRALPPVAVGFGLISASAFLVHLSGGAIEFHFHFFVVLAFLALYQDRISYLLVVVYLLIYHVLVGAIWPHHVYGHSAALAAPLKWAAIHSFFFIAAAIGNMSAWRFNQKAFAESSLILNSAGEGIFGIDLQQRILFMNSAAAELLNCQADEVLGKTTHQILRHTRADGSEFSNLPSSIVASLRDGAKHQAADELFWRIDGTSFPVEYKCAPIFERNALAGTIVTFSDISTLKRRETALRESEERFRQIAENIKEVFWITDPSNNEKLYISPAYREIWGRDPAKIGSLSQSWLGLLHKDDRVRVLGAVSTKQSTGQYSEEYRIVRDDGSVRWIKDRAFPVRSESGEVYRMVGLAEDITERKQAQQDLLDRYSELAVLHDVSQAILSATDLGPVLENIVDRALATLSLDIGNIRLFEPVGTTRIGIYRGYRDQENTRVYADMKNSRSDALAMRIIESGKSLVLENLTAGDGLLAFIKEQVSSAIVVPIILERETLGVMEVGSRTPFTFRPQDVRLLNAIGNQVGLAIQKARLLHETERRANEQGALNLIAKAISQSLHTDELLKIALEKVFEVTGRERLSIRLKNSADNGMTLAAHRGFSPEETEELVRPSTDSIVRDVFASGQPLVINNSPTIGNSEALSPQKNPAGMIPIKAGTHVVGILAVSAVRPVPFELRELELLEAIGNMIGVALEKARLFSETEARYRELKTLQAISDTILESLDVTVMMERILDKAFEVGRFDCGVIRLLDRDHDRLRLVASRGHRDHEAIVNHYETSEQKSTARIIAEVMASKQTKVKDLSASDGMRTFRREGVCTVVAIPLHTQHDVLGIIQLGSRTVREFQESELRVFDAIGGQAGIAIQKARLYEESQQAQAALREKAAQLTRSNIDLQQSTQEVKSAKEKLERVNSLLTAQAAELARSNTELEQFAYVASHDLQEPLRMVASYVQLLARRYKGKLDSEAEEFIGFAVDGSKRMQDLIQALLAYSRIGTKGRQFAPTNCEIVLQTALKNLQIAIEDSQARITHDPLPTIIGDAIQLGQLFQNLIGNAIKFRGERPPSIHVTAERQAGDWLFSFHDDGIGIDSQYAERIFVIFQRLHTKEEYPGTGIGLALCKKIVERHNGRIWVESQPHKGSTFRFTLPGEDSAEGDKSL